MPPTARKLAAGPCIRARTVPPAPRKLAAGPCTGAASTIGTEP